MLPDASFTPTMFGIAASFTSVAGSTLQPVRPGTLYTTIGSGVKVSVHTSFVAPVKIGDGAYTRAGTGITDDVPPRARGIARERQRNVEGYAERAPRKAR